MTCGLDPGTTTPGKTYVYWQTQDRKVLRRINLLIADILRIGNTGIGNAEPLRYDFAGYWSRRITDDADRCTSR